MLTATTAWTRSPTPSRRISAAQRPKLTRAMSEEAATRIVRSLYTAYENGGDMQARADMLRAAYCAGVSFTRSYVGYVHGVAHSLGGQYGVPHGLANAVILPYFSRRLRRGLPSKSWAGSPASRIVAPKAPPTARPPRRSSAGSRNERPNGIPETIPQIRTADIPRWRTMPPGEQPALSRARADG